MHTAPDMIHQARRLLHDAGAADLKSQCAAIRAAIAAGGGSWMDPETHSDSARPGTHLFEIQLHGIAATGETAEQAVANWFLVAPRILRGVAA